jgi:flagellar motor switch protein FliM
MSSEVVNLSKEKITQLLMAVGSGPLTDTTNIKSTDYNWNQPHYFDRRQLNRLDEFSKRVARAMSVQFVDFCHIDSDVTVDSITQHFAAEYIEKTMESGQNDFYLSFGTDLDNPFGVISIPNETALSWASQLLGDSESSSEEDLNRDMTQLEESLLAD